jgi:hypothetical protein
MKKAKWLLFFLVIPVFLLSSCKKQTAGPAPVKKDSALINLGHLNDLYTPLVFPSGTQAAGVFIYSAYPDYHHVEASGEGFTCLDDVSRAALVYFRSDQFASDTAIQKKALNLIRFILEMQAGDGYFYNFFQTDGTINTTGTTSMAIQNWWSWRALQTLAETSTQVKALDSKLGSGMDLAVNRLIQNIKADLVNLPLTTEVVSGITVPKWLPAGSATDQAATLILGLISYCRSNNDPVIQTFIQKLADGIVMMQEGSAAAFPYSLFLSAQNQWHAYGSDQSYALLLTGEFLNDTSYTSKALAEINNFYPWLIANGYKSGISLSYDSVQFQPILEKDYDQIAYGFRPMVFAAAEAFALTGQNKYADIAGHLAAWFLGSNTASANMYDSTTGLCYDAISSAGNVNLNSGAESTIEALLTMQRVQKYPAIRTALYTYKKHF